jgi:hypothetical protein
MWGEDTYWVGSLDRANLNHWIIDLLDRANLNHWIIGPLDRTNHNHWSMVQWLRLALSKGPNWVGVFPPTPEDGNNYSLRNVVFSGSYSIERWEKSKNPIILSGIIGGVQKLNTHLKCAFMAPCLGMRVNSKFTFIITLLLVSGEWDTRACSMSGVIYKCLLVFSRKAWGWETTRHQGVHGRNILKLILMKKKCMWPNEIGSE